MKTLVTFILALALHLILGWAWTLLAGIAGGGWSGRGGWRTGAAGVALAWGVLVAYNLIVAPGPVRQMLATMGELLGGLPGVALALLTVLMGGVLGALGGLIGAQVALLLRSEEQREHPESARATAPQPVA